MLAKNPAMIILIAGLLAIAGALCLCFSDWEIAGFLAAGFALICVQALGAAPLFGPALEGGAGDAQLAPGLDGADPASTPVMTFDNGTATVNTEACTALGLDYATLEAAFAPLCTKVQPITTAESFDDLK